MICSLLVGLVLLLWFARNSDYARERDAKNREILMNKMKATNNAPMSTKEELLKLKTLGALIDKESYYFNSHGFVGVRNSLYFDTNDDPKTTEAVLVITTYGKPCVKLDILIHDALKSKEKLMLSDWENKFKTNKFNHSNECQGHFYRWYLVKEKD